ncbi:hypothetical protein M231_02775 [Tremella mesenterica]|uniref:Uncharacterized protein n=1 Tax=Tremella mesenterica TaxID=5217 RepID=A0A4Q1BQ51_TREME|nr:hypothetical protein M231_02775 [Tremella mesenterica]
MYSLTHLLAILPLLVTLGGAQPVKTSFKREVPQEHSHEQFLTTVRASLNVNNPLGIKDVVFGLLGNAAASAGQGQVTDTDCLQQATADQAFTNAKAANDVAGMTAALIYRALERNTGAVGQASVLWSSTFLTNPSAAITQHQDPASANAAATNKQIVLELAKQIASIGGNPQDAIKSGTFAPGVIGDPTGAGKTCDVANDPTGCIFTQNLLVPDATPDEIDAAVSAAGLSNVASNSTSTASNLVSDACAANGTCSAGQRRRRALPTKRQNAGIDVGPCTDFSMTFAAGFDNRGAEESFEPTDTTNFAHGSALNPDIIAKFMCDTFVNQCAKSASTRDTCATVEADLLTKLNDGTLQKDQSYADAWLAGLESAFGITSTGTGSGSAAASSADASSAADDASTAAEDDCVDDTVPEDCEDDTSDDSTATTTSSTDAATAAVTAATTTAAAAATSDATTTAAAAAATGSVAVGTNVNTFTGALNGAQPVPVTFVGGERAFQVNGDTFVNKSAAIQRACSVQNNACADAFNSKKGTSSVADCNAQEQKCEAQSA